MSHNPTSNLPREMTLARSGLPVEVRRHPRARRYRLAVRPDGSIRLTLPKSGSLKEGADFLSRQETWIESARARILAKKRPDAPDWSDGSPVWFRGLQHSLKTGMLDGIAHVTLADQSIRIHPPVPSNLRTEVESHLRKLAIQEFPELVTRLAVELSVKVNRISVRDQRTRWGSCSRRGTISLNWRLIQAPAYVLRYLIVHELMHLREMNHSDRFWSHVEAACPDYRTAEIWLKTVGPVLQRPHQ